MSEKRQFFNRFTSLILIMIILFSLLLTRLTYLQIVQAESFKQKADTQGTTEIDETAPRGDILDKNGIKLATSKQSYTLTFTKTTESDLYFYHTMDKIFKVLDGNKDTQKDDFELKVNPFLFNFKGEDDTARKQLELRFKKDRGLDEEVEKKLFPNKTDDLTSEESNKLDAALLKVTPEATFDYLVKLYNITPEGILKNYAELYKTNAKAAKEIIESDYTVNSKSELVNLLDQYKAAKKDSVSKAILNKLIQECNVSSKVLTPELQRKYMLVKDAIKMQSISSPGPVTIATNIKKDTAFLISQILSDLPGIDVTIQPIRYYPYAQLGADVVGYISKISTNQEHYQENGYDVSSDYVGISGIESAFENFLKGSKGAKIVKINSAGRVMEELGTRDSYPGDNVQLTIDSNVQYAAQVSLDKIMKQLQAQHRAPNSDVDTSNATRAAAVAVDVNTGGILALVSSPSFNPNDFVNPSGLSTDLFKKYFQPDLEAFGKSKGYDQAKIDKLFPIADKDTGTRKDQYDLVPRPLYNYATLSLTPPGSTFKPLTAIAGLETGVITPDTIVQDNALFDDGNGFKTTFPSDQPNGPVNLVKALAKSSNPYFMTVGQRLREAFGDNILAKYAWKFGLGVDPTSNTKPSTGIEIPENYGQVFNTTSIKNLFAVSYLYIAMDTLKSGKGYLGSFSPIELHLNGDESDDVKAARQKIRDQIQTSIKTGDRADDTYIDLLTKLIAVDPLYKGKNISKSEIEKIALTIEHITVDDAYFQTTIGANMYNASIGQGIDNFTPLQLADYIATIVNGGTRYSLHLVDKVTDPNGNVIQQNEPEVVEKTGIKQSTVDAVKAGMQAVNGDDGTARAAFVGFPINTAGKTGSATYRKDQDELGRTSYGVYVGFAPYNNPQIAVAIVIFDGGHGSFVAPVARAMYEAYFKKELDAMHYTPQNDIAAKPITQ